MRLKEKKKERFHQDSAPWNRSIPHSSYLPDLGPSDFYFESRAHIIAKAEAKDELFYDKRIIMLDKSWNICVALK